jgi:hypothetical protein
MMKLRQFKKCTRACFFLKKWKDYNYVKLAKKTVDQEFSSHAVPILIKKNDLDFKALLSDHSINQNLNRIVETLQFKRFRCFFASSKLTITLNVLIVAWIRNEKCIFAHFNFSILKLSSVFGINLISQKRCFSLSKCY